MLGLFDRSLQISQDIQAAITEMQVLAREHNERALQNLILNFNQNYNRYTEFVQHVVNDTNSTVASAEKIIIPIQSASLEIANLVGKVSQHSEFFHATLHLLDSISKRISNVDILANNFTKTSDLYNVRCINSH